jgi:hypothetical protein
VDNILQEMAKLVYSSIRDYVEWSPDGLVIKESGKLARARAVRDQEFMCDFNSSRVDKLIQLALAAGRSVRESSFEGRPVVPGVDAARFGDDESAICWAAGPGGVGAVDGGGPQDGGVGDEDHGPRPQVQPGADTHGAGGGGQGVVDYGRRVLEGKAIEVPFGSMAVDDMAYVNRRTDLWAAMRRFRPDGGCIPEESALISQLTAPTYAYDNAGRMALEKKSRLKDRLSVSLDKANAMALTFAVQVMPDAFQRALPRRAVGRRTFWGRGADWM